MTNQIIEDELQDDSNTQMVNVNAVSLGKPCNHNGQCQIRDPYSLCIGGICECIKKSNTCNSTSTGNDNMIMYLGC